MKITKTVYLVATKAARWMDEDYHYSLFDFPPFANYIAISEQEITFDVPDDFDYVNAQVDILKAEKSKIEADAYIKTQNIQEQIEGILAIEVDTENSI